MIGYNNRKIKMHEIGTASTDLSDPSKQLTCLICSQSFLSIDELKEHVRNPCRNPVGRKRPHRLLDSRTNDYNYPYTPGQPVFPSSSITRNVFNDTQKPVSVITPEAAMAAIQNREAAFSESFETRIGEADDAGRAQTGKENFLTLLECLKQVAEESASGDARSEISTDFPESTTLQEVIIDNYAAENTIRNGGASYCDDESVVYDTKVEGEVTAGGDTAGGDTAGVESDSRQPITALPHEPGVKQPRLAPQSLPEAYDDTHVIFASTAGLDSALVLSTIRIINKEPFVVSADDTLQGNPLDAEFVYLDEESGKVRSYHDGKEVITAENLLSSVNHGSSVERDQFLRELGTSAIDWLTAGNKGKKSSELCSKTIVSPELDAVELKAESADMKSLGHPLDILAASAVERSRIERAQRESLDKQPQQTPADRTDKYTVVCNAVISSFEAKLHAVRTSTAKPTGFEDEKNIPRDINSIDEQLTRLRNRVMELENYFAAKSDERRRRYPALLAKLVLQTAVGSVDGVYTLFQDTLNDFPRLSRERRRSVKSDDYRGKYCNSASQSSSHDTLSQLNQLVDAVISDCAADIPAPESSFVSSGGKHPIKIANINLVNRTITVPSVAAKRVKPVEGAETGVDSGLIELLVAQQQAAYTGHSDDLSISRHDVFTRDVRGENAAQGEGLHGGAPQSDVTMTQYVTDDGQVIYIQSDENEAGVGDARSTQSVSGADAQNPDVIEIANDQSYTIIDDSGNVTYMNDAGQQLVWVNCDGAVAPTVGQDVLEWGEGAVQYVYEK